MFLTLFCLRFFCFFPAFFPPFSQLFHFPPFPVSYIFFDSSKGLSYTLNTPVNTNAPPLLSSPLLSSPLLSSPLLSSPLLSSPLLSSPLLSSPLLSSPLLSSPLLSSPLLSSLSSLFSLLSFISFFSPPFHFLFFPTRDLARIWKLPVLWEKLPVLTLLVESNYERIAWARARKAREPLRRGVQGPA